MTQQQLADLLLLSKSRVDQWEHDKGKPTELEVVASLLAKLGRTTAESIIGDEELPPAQTTEEKVAAALARLGGQEPAGARQPADLAA